MLLVPLVAIKPASAQSRLSSADAGPTHAFTVNPFFILAGWVSGEYEQRVNSSLGLGGAVSYVDIGDNQYTSFDFKGRLYPTERALRGFEMAMSLGVTHLSFEDDPCFIDVFNSGSDCTVKKKSVTTPAVGVEFGYQWMLGTNRRTVIALGGGAKRFLASKADLEGTTRVIPTFRVGIGYAW